MAKYNPVINDKERLRIWKPLFDELIKSIEFISGAPTTRSAEPFRITADWIINHQDMDWKIRNTDIDPKRYFNLYIY